MNAYAQRMMSEEALNRLHNSAMSQAEKALDKGRVHLYEMAMTTVLETEDEMKRRKLEGQSKC